jgi:hypothetical protein
MNIDIRNDNCFMCNNNKVEDKHHMIPQTLQPKNNITVGVCKDCHDKLNMSDTVSIRNYLTSIAIQSSKLSGKLTNINKRLDKKDEEQRCQSSQTV